MELVLDDDVKAVAEFMQGNITASKLISVASAIAALAPILWGRYAPEPITALALAAPQPSPSLSESATSPPAANGSGLGSPCAGDGSVAAADAVAPR